MHGPSLVAWLLVVLSAAAAASCLLRGEGRSEALTGAGMAVMAVPLTVFDPGPWGAAVFAAVFALAAVHALVRRTPHRLHHTVCSGAMVYMAVSMAAAGPAHAEHAAHLSAGVPLLTGLLLLYFAGYVLRAGLSVVPGTAVAVGTTGTVGTTGGVRAGGTAGTVAPAGPAGSAGSGHHRARISTGSGPVRLRHAPEVAVACRVAMALGMLAMLLAL